MISCKLCSDDLTDRNKKRLKTVASVHADLFDLVNDLCEIARVSKPDIHRFLLLEPKYLCKDCHSIISRYTELKPQLKKLQDKLLASLQSNPDQVQ